MHQDGDENKGNYLSYLIPVGSPHGRYLHVAIRPDRLRRQEKNEVVDLSQDSSDEDSHAVSRPPPLRQSFLVWVPNGHVMVFSDQLVHGATPNITEEPQLALYLSSTISTGGAFQQLYSEPVCTYRSRALVSDIIYPLPSGEESFAPPCHSRWSFSLGKTVCVVGLSSHLKL